MSVKAGCISAPRVARRGAKTAGGCCTNCTGSDPIGLRESDPCAANNADLDVRRLQRCHCHWIERLGMLNRARRCSNRPSRALCVCFSTASASVNSTAKFRGRLRWGHPPAAPRLGGCILGRVNGFFLPRPVGSASSLGTAHTVRCAPEATSADRRGREDEAGRSADRSGPLLGPQQVAHQLSLRTMFLGYPVHALYTMNGDSGLGVTRTVPVCKCDLRLLYRQLPPPSPRDVSRSALGQKNFRNVCRTCFFLMINKCVAGDGDTDVCIKPRQCQRGLTPRGP